MKKRILALLAAGTSMLLTSCGARRTPHSLMWQKRQR